MLLVPSVSCPLPGRPAMQQHPHYAGTLRALGLEVRRLSVFDPQPIAHLQVVLRRFGPLRIAWVPQGPVWEAAVSDEAHREVLHALRRTLPRTHVHLIGASDSSQDPLRGAAGFRRLTAPQSHAWLDLGAGASARLARQNGKWRNRLRHAQSCGLRISCRRFSCERDRGLLQLEQTQRRAKGYRALPPGFTLAWASANANAAQLFEAHGPHGLAAFILVLTHPPTASYHIGWSGDAGRATSAHNLLLWRASCWLSERGYSALDLGLIDARRTPGLARFKLGIGAETHAGGATYLALPRLRLPQMMHRAA